MWESWGQIEYSPELRGCLCDLKVLDFFFKVIFDSSAFNMALIAVASEATFFSAIISAQSCRNCCQSRELFSCIKTCQTLSFLQVTIKKRQVCVHQEGRW
jgi:3-keto-L-gulonate-6-phosphate decarboxylase